MHKPILIRNARVVTMTQKGTLEKADVLVREGFVEQINTLIDVPDDAKVIEAAGRVLMPSFIDAHTHACWAGDRFGEWERRLGGASYLELLESGGGIMATVRAVRDASEAELCESLLERLNAMLRHGTTTVEVKSGYGLNTKTELKMLRAIAQAAKQWPGTVVLTACIGHAKDPEADNPVRTTVTETLPAVHAEFPGIAIDAYCEQGAWSVEECVQLFEAARKLGHPIRVHTDQFNSLGMVDEALRLGAMSVDHLEATPPEVLGRIGESDTCAVVLPCSGFHVDDRYADARTLVDCGATVVLATNCNPGSAPCVSIPMAIALGVRKCGLSTHEALQAVTTNASRLLGFADRGRVEVGARADLVMLEGRDERALAHDFGSNPVRSVLANGRLVVG